MMFEVPKLQNNELNSRDFNLFIWNLFDKIYTIMNSPLTLLLTLITVISSYQGLQNKIFFDKYTFNIEGILKYKEYYRLISSGFLHGSWWHLLFNLYVLFSFGETLESVIGSINLGSVTECML